MLAEMMTVTDPIGGYLISHFGLFFGTLLEIVWSIGMMICSLVVAFAILAGLVWIISKLDDSEDK